MRIRQLAGLILTTCVVLSLGFVEPSAAQEREFYPNHFGGVVGVSTHHDSGSSGPTLGLEYARRLAKSVAVIGYIELVSSELERDMILAAGIAYYPVSHLSVAIALGAESAERAKDGEDGQPTEERETAFMIRLSLGYGFPLTSAAGLGPIVLIDRAAGRWTSLIGLAFIVGF